ncbi:MAG: tyrosine-type recombinase/integrase [Clostridiales bacterium]|nr:tyrosine-type recombinase/integrase [Clostridiales bacterium]
MDDFYKQRDELNNKKIEAICDELPSYVHEFIIGIHMRTSPLTRLNYVYDLRIFFDYLSKKVFKALQPNEIELVDLEKLKASDIESFLYYLSSSYEFQGKKYTCKERAVERKLCTLRSFFKYFFNKDKLSSNICAKVALPKKHEKPIIRLETDEVVKLLDRADSDNLTDISKRENSYHEITRVRDVAILTLFLGTGMRISELVGLNRDDFNFSECRVRVTRKGGNQTELYFTNEIAAALQDYCAWQQQQIEYKTPFGNKIANQNAMFYSLQGKRISVRAVENLVKKYASHITEKKITPHKLRSTFGTELYRNTQDIYAVATVLGHKDINTTRRHYAATSEDIKRRAAQTVKLRDND